MSSTVLGTGDTAVTRVPALMKFILAKGAAHKFANK